MEEQNKIIENQQPENKNNETNIKTKKPLPKKTIIIASIIAAVAIIATIVCILTFNKSKEENAIVGEWFSIDDDYQYVFYEDGTAILRSDEKTLVDLTWNYDSETQEYYMSFLGVRIPITMYTYEDITYFYDKMFGYAFKEEDREKVLEYVSEIRDDIFDKKLKNKTMLAAGQEITTDNAKIVINNIMLSQDQSALLCKVSITAIKQLSVEEMEQLILRYKEERVESNTLLSITLQSYTVGSPCIHIGNVLAAGETLEEEFNININSFILEDFENWGQIYGYSVLKFGGIEYFVDWTKYTQEKPNRNLLFDLIDDYYVVTGLGNYPSTDVVIPSTYNGLPVKAISDNAFSNKSHITSITIPNSVISIGERAFSNCSGLKSITISDSVTSIGDEAFCYCTALEEIHFNATTMNDLTYDAEVFKNAGSSGTGIKVVIGKNVTKIPAHLFYADYYGYRPKLNTVEFEEGSVCTSIGYGAFYQCINQNDVIIPDSVINIGYNAFEHNYGH